MPSNTKAALVAVARVVRAAIVVAGVGIAAATVYHLATLPPPPPDSDGFAHGMAAIFGSAIIVTALGIAAVSVALPTVLGRDDPLGFNPSQRLALKAAGALVGGGFLLGVGYGYLTMLPFGVLLWLVFVVLAALLVGATLVWRLAEVVAGRLSLFGEEEDSS